MILGKGVTKELEQKLDAMSEGRRRDTGRWATKYAGLGYTVRDLYGRYSNALGLIGSHGIQAGLLIERTANDDTIFPLGRERIIAATRASAREKIRQEQRAARVALASLRELLFEMALPPVDRKREALLRDEAKMILDNAPDPVQQMLDMTQRTDELAAVVTSTWAESYLRARGVRDAPKAHATVRRVAVEFNSARHPDPEVRRAAEAWRDVPIDLEPHVTSAYFSADLENGLELEPGL